MMGQTASITRVAERPPLLEQKEFLPVLTTQWAESFPIAVTQLQASTSKFTSSITEEVRDAVNKLRQEVRIRKPEEVEDYLARFLDLLGVIGKIVHTAREQLPSVELSLEVYHDPEVEDEHLVLYARFRRYDKTTMERIRAVRKAYRHLLSNRSGWVILTTDFRPPEDRSYAF